MYCTPEYQPLFTSYPIYLEINTTMNQLKRAGNQGTQHAVTTQQRCALRPTMQFMQTIP